MIRAAGSRGRSRCYSFGMKQATIAIAADLDAALAAYERDHELTDGLDALVDAALRELLARHGYPAHSPIEAILVPPFRPLGITPLHREDGPTDVSVNHDRYLADDETGGPG